VAQGGAEAADDPPRGQAAQGFQKGLLRDVQFAGDRKVRALRDRDVLLDGGDYFFSMSVSMGELVYWVY
jgi:hypothetical protein